MRRTAGLVWGVMLGVLALATLAAPAQTVPARPRLFVMLVFDQMRGDYLLRWHDLFGDDGFRRLEREGTWFTNCNYPYARTYTGPGHASLSTGCSPARHGIVDNDWFDRAAGTNVYCASSDRYRAVLTDPPPAAATTRRETASCPDRLLVPTFSDALKEATGGKAKVVAVSLKDRSAVMPGGHKPDACYWFDDRSGTFCTSTYYRDRPHAWVNEFNKARPIDRWFTQTWERLRPDLDYAKYSGPDDVAGESTGISRRQGRTFPHPMNAGLTQPGKAYFDTVEASPFGNDLVLELALRALDAEKLGTGDVPDFLSISFSSNDLIGHAYGPDSQEEMDVTLRSDLTVRDLLNALDRKVGKGQYVVGLSADHGVCPLPEVSAAHGLDARRLNPAPLETGAIAFLQQTYGGSATNRDWFNRQDFPWLYLNHKTLAARGLQIADVSDALAGYLRKQPGVQAVYTLRQMQGGVAADDAIGQRVRKSYYPGRSGDLFVVNKPYWLFTTSTSGTSHGTPNSYDTHVPLLVAGSGVPVGRSEEAVTPQAVVPIFAQLAGIAPPSGCDTPLPARMSRK